MILCGTLGSVEMWTLVSSVSAWGILNAAGQPVRAPKY